MPRFHASVTEPLNAPPERALAILRDYRAGHPAILPRPPFTALEVLEGGTGAGTVIVVGMKAYGKERRIKGVVNEPEPGLIVETYEGDLVTRFLVRDGNITLATEGATQAGGLLGKIEAWLTVKALERTYREEIRLIETRAKA